MKIKVKWGVFVALVAVALLSLACSLLLVGCTDPNEGQQEKVVSGISLDTHNAKTDFLIGDKFSTLGLGIVVRYTDGTESLQLANGDDVKILEPSLDSIGRKNVSVQYKDFVAEYTVTVSRVDGIELNLSNAKRDYVVGDELSLYGLAVSAKITTLNEMGNEVSSYRTLSALDYTVEAPEFTQAGKKTVTVSYTADKEYVNSFDVYVTPAVTDDAVLNFDGEGSLTLFVTDRTGGGSADADAQAEGWYLLIRRDGTFDMYKMNVRYNASDKSSVFEGAVSTAVSQDGSKLVASIEGKEYSVGIAIYRTKVLGWGKQLVEIRIDAPSSIKEYLVGATFTYEGLKAFAVYSDGSSEEVDASTLTVQAPSQSSMNEVGVKTVNGFYTSGDGTKLPFSYQIYCIPDVPWETNKLDFGADQNGSGATLELFVTERSASAENGAYWGTSDQNSKGWLLVKNADGSYEMYQFEFYLAWDVSSHPYPNGAPDGVSSRVPPNGQQYSDNLVIEIHGKIFVADNNDLWHLIVIGWK